MKVMLSRTIGKVVAASVVLALVAVVASCSAEGPTAPNEDDQNKDCFYYNGVLVCP